MVRPDTASTNIYKDGSYLVRTSGTWHLQDARLKADWIMRMLERHPEIQPERICDIGCGAGGVLAELQTRLSHRVRLAGYDISPQAIALCQAFANERCRYILGDPFRDEETYDLVLVMDVVEHVEDCFTFLRQTARKGLFKIYHLPLETHVRAVLSGFNNWNTVGHLHLFTTETALNTITYSEQTVIDWAITAGALEKPAKPLGNRLMNVIRRPLHKLSPVMSARLLGGCSILILAR